LIKVIPSVEKKLINSKQRYDFMLQIIHFEKRTVYFIQADSNIWWKPKRIVKKWDNSHGRSVGWLFVQVGYLTFDKL